MPDPRHRHGRDPGFRPPWWPEGEAFPPDSGEQWKAARGRFLRRIAIGIGLFLIFVFVVGWLGAIFGGGFHRGGQGGRFFPGFWLIPLLLSIATMIATTVGMAIPAMRHVTGTTNPSSGSSPRSAASRRSARHAGRTRSSASANAAAP